ncbi:MAG: hypothetical protein ACYC5G_04000 [Candidatus Doudnabacteria bacterium]
MGAKINLKITQLEMSHLLDIVTTVEGMIGGSDNGKSDDLVDWDTQMTTNIKKFDSMLKRNGFKRL